jgi:chemotaxis response regulator CheB
LVNLKYDLSFLDPSEIMPEPKPSLRRVLIVSANPLFREGLRKIYAERWEAKAFIAGTATTMSETLAALHTDPPDLIIVDYDDKTINRAEFLEHFVFDEIPMQVMLVSLGKSGEVLIYDRKRLTPSQAETWDPWPGES